MGLALKQSAFSVYGKPFIIGFRDSQTPGWVSRVRREVYPQGTSIWYFPLSTLSAKVGNLMQRKLICWYF